MMQAFIHGIDQNPVAALAQELGLTLVPMDDCKLSASDGRPVPEAMDQRIQALWNKVLDECAEKQQQQQQKQQKQEEEQHDDQSNNEAGDSRGETSEESHGENSSSAESEAAEAAGTNVMEARASSDEGPSEIPPTHTQGTAIRESLPVNGSSTSTIGGEGRPRDSIEQDHPRDRASSKKRSPGRRATPRAPESLGQVLDETARAHVASFSRAEHELWGWHRGNLEISCGAVSPSG